MTPSEELFGIAEQLGQVAQADEETGIEESISALKEAVRQISTSFSGSWQGYHSHVYYADLATPPAGAHFSQEWGLKDTHMTSLGSHGDWREYHTDYIRDHILDMAGQPNLSDASEASKIADKEFNTCQSEINSIIQNELEDGDGPFLEKLLSELEKLKPTTAFEVADHMSPAGQFLTRDTVVLGQGMKIPPHISLFSEVRAIENSFDICEAASDIARKAGAHLERKNKINIAPAIVGKSVFIGHGQSPVWRDLKDFIHERIKLPWDEFNRVPVAGVTNIERLSEMLDAAAVAFLVMTAEDEMVTGSFQARLNVIHEAGLFQGRLGFTRAIVLFEDGCEQFSNINGLGQIKFPKGNISAAFEEIRRVLEREDLIEYSA